MTTGKPHIFLAAGVVKGEIRRYWACTDIPTPWGRLPPFHTARLWTQAFQFCRLRNLKEQR